MEIRKSEILNPFFLTSLFILILNDAFLKFYFPNFITGKLSDIFGLIVFAQCASVFSNGKATLYTIVAVLFIYWKSPFSQTLIDNWNIYVSQFSINRTIDYTDTLCLLVLIPLYKYYPGNSRHSSTLSILFKPMFVVALFGMIASSKPDFYYGNDIEINKRLKFNLSEKELIDKIEKNGYAYTLAEKIVLKKDTFNHYVFRNISIFKDTINELHLGLLDREKSVIALVHRLQLNKNSEVKFGSYRGLRYWERLWKKNSKELIERLEK